MFQILPFQCRQRWDDNLHCLIVFVSILNHPMYSHVNSSVPCRWVKSYWCWIGVRNFYVRAVRCHHQSLEVEQFKQCFAVAHPDILWYDMIWHDILRHFVYQKCQVRSTELQGCRLAKSPSANDSEQQSASKFDFLTKRDVKQCRQHANNKPWIKASVSAILFQQMHIKFIAAKTNHSPNKFTCGVLS